ncbi:hypothetical protein JCM3765_003681 [Sporobolomyces pararoseus]
MVNSTSYSGPGSTTSSFVGSNSVIIPITTSSSSSASSPTNEQRPQHLREIQLEELYDSPERTRRGNSINVEDEEEVEEGDLASGYSRKGKAKFKQNEILQEEEEEDEQQDEEAEERKIIENLAKWSQQDRKRRASIRRQSQFVTPSLNLPSPPPVPSPSSIIRRTSTIIRKKTISRRSEGEEQEGVMELRTSTRSTTTRKGMRKSSVVIEQGRDGFVSPDSVLELPLFEGETPPISPRQSTNEPIVLPSNRTSTSTNDSGSRFIEDLSPIPSSSSSSVSSSPTKSIPSSLHQHQNNPFSPPKTPTKNPFSDSTTTIDLDSTPTTTTTSMKPTQMISARNYKTRGRGESIDSFRSLSSSATATMGGPPTSIEENDYRDRDRIGTNQFDYPVESDYYHSERPFFRDEQQLSTTSSPRIFPETSHTTKSRQEEQEEENEEVRNSVGLLDWLLCGCWRPRGWESGGDVRDGEQQGRTNPME